MPPTTGSDSANRSSLAARFANGPLGGPNVAARGLLAVSGGLLIAASLLPWAVGVTAGGEPVAYRPTEGLGEGVYMLLGGIVLVFLAALRQFAETTNRLLQVVPFVVAGIVGAMWLNASRYALTAIAGWQFGGGEGGQTLGPLMAPAGVVLAVVAGLWLETRRPDELRRQTRSLVAELGLTRRGLLGVAIAALFGILGGAAGMGMTVVAFGIQGVLPGILLGIFGFLLGVALGGRVARRIGATG
jgi:hypothetical protein